MKIYNLKTILIAICCFVITICSGSQGMDTLTDGEEKAYISKTDMQSSCQNDVNSLYIDVTHSDSVNLKGSNTFWTSLLSPVNSVIQTTNKFIEVAAHNPKLAMVVGLSFIITAVEAGCQCNCGGNYVGCTPDVMTCVNVCSAANQTFWGCYGTC